LCPWLLPPLFVLVVYAKPFENSILNVVALHEESVDLLAVHGAHKVKTKFLMMKYAPAMGKNMEEMGKLATAVKKCIILRQHAAIYCICNH
jgi:hypothetical protein